MRSKFLFAGAVALSLALSSEAANAVTKGSDTAAAAQQTSPDSTKRYCVIVKAVTGTMLDRKVCMTRDKLRAQGIDPTKSPAQQ